MLCRRGLSKYFQGKSQSFTSLSSVKSIEELVKKETPYRKKMKSCRSYGGGLDTHKLYTLPRATISKKVSRNSMSSLSFPGRRSSFLSGRHPLIPVQKNFWSVHRAFLKLNASLQHGIFFFPCRYCKEFAHMVWWWTDDQICGQNYILLNSFFMQS